MAQESAAVDDRYPWVALANTTASTFMATLDGSIVIIALPAIFRGIGLDPLAPGSIFYLLWMIMGYRLVQAVLVVSVGRLGDMFGRVKIYNAGFVVFTIASILLSFDPFRAGGGAMWLIGWRVLQATGGSMLMANSAAILTDAWPAERRGFALGTNQIAALAGQFVGLVAGGLLAAIDWRAVFWINVPVGVFGTLWAYLRLREMGERHRARMDWWGNLTFALGLSAVLVGVTVGIQPYQGHAMGWTSPTVIGLLAGGVLLLAGFIVIERTIAEPMFQLSLFRIRAFTAGSIASLVVAIARGGQQFMLIIWLQGIWLPLHGYSFSQTSLWAGIFLLPLTAGFLVSGLLLDHGQRPGPAPRRGLGYARYLPELRHGAVDRRVLLADDRRAVGQPAQHVDRRPGEVRRPARRRPPDRFPCRRSRRCSPPCWGQPHPAPARLGPRASKTPGRQPADPDRA
jgi:MFS family permease